MDKKYLSKLANIEILSRYIKDSYDELDMDNLKYIFTVDNHIEANFIDKTIDIEVNIKVNAEGSEGNSIECGGIKLLLNFIVEYDSKYIKDKKYDENVIISIGEIAIDTSRGIMWDSFRGTYLHRAILPIMTGEKLIPKRKSSKVAK